MTIGLLNQALALGILFESGILISRHSNIQRLIGFFVLAVYFSVCILIYTHHHESAFYILAMSSSFIVWGLLFDLKRTWALWLAAANAAANYGLTAINPSFPST